MGASQGPGDGKPSGRGEGETLSSEPKVSITIAGERAEMRYPKSQGTTLEDGSLQDDPQAGVCRIPFPVFNISWACVGSGFVPALVFAELIHLLQLRGGP